MGSPTGSVDGGAQSCASPSAAVTTPRCPPLPRQLRLLASSLILLAVSFFTANAVVTTASRRHGPSRTKVMGFSQSAVAIALASAALAHRGEGVDISSLAATADKRGLYYIEDRGEDDTAAAGADAEFKSSFVSPVGDAELEEMLVRALTGRHMGTERQLRRRFRRRLRVKWPHLKLGKIVTASEKRLSVAQKEPALGLMLVDVPFQTRMALRQDFHKEDLNTPPGDGKSCGA